MGRAEIITVALGRSHWLQPTVGAGVAVGPAAVRLVGEGGLELGGDDGSMGWEGTQSGATRAELKLPVTPGLHTYSGLGGQSVFSTFSLFHQRLLPNHVNAQPPNLPPFLQGVRFPGHTLPNHASLIQSRTINLKWCPGHSGQFHLLSL